MHLSDDQIRHYDEQGFVVLPNLFSAAEVRRLQADADLLATDRRGHPDANVYEKNGRIRAAWAMEIDSDAFAAALHDRRVLDPVMQLLGQDVYLFQSRLNFKVAFEGDVFQWHQDYASWYQDGAPRGGQRDMLTVLIMLDDTAPDNGPLRFIPGSHAGGMIEPEYDTTTTSYPLHVVPDPVVAELSARLGVYENVGGAGSAVFFCGNLVHGSTANRSPRGRRNAYFAFNRLDNTPLIAQSRRAHSNPYIMTHDPQRLVPAPALHETSPR